LHDSRKKQIYDSNCEAIRYDRERPLQYIEQLEENLGKYKIYTKQIGEK